MFLNKKVSKEITETHLSDFKKNVLRSNFETAYEISKNMSIEKIFDELYAVAEMKMETNLPYNLLPYAFVTSVLRKEETVEYHLLAADLMTMPYLVLPGSCEIALFHAREALKLGSNCKKAAGIVISLYEHEVTSATEEEYQNALKVLQA